MTPAQLLALIVLVDIRRKKEGGVGVFDHLEARAFALFDNPGQISTASLLATAERMRAEELETGRY